MANNVEFRDSCATDDSLRYLTWGGTTAGAGRGGRRGNGVNSAYNKWSVSAEANKVLAVAWKIDNANADLSMSFAESGTQHVTITRISSGKLEVRRGSASGTLLATSSSAVCFLGDYPHVEAKVAISDTVGSVAVKVNEVLVAWDATLTNVDTKNGGTGVINELWTGAVTYANARFCDVLSQFAGADWIGDKAVLYSPAASAGTYTDGIATGAGTRLQCVDESPSNGDTDYIAQDATGLPKAASFGITAAPANVIAIVDVAPVCLTRKDDAGSDLVRGLLISGATEDDGGADVAVISTYSNIFGTGAGGRHYQTDPNTSAAWTITNFNNIQVGRRRVA